LCLLRKSPLPPWQAHSVTCYVPSEGSQDQTPPHPDPLPPGEREFGVRLSRGRRRLDTKYEVAKIATGLTPLAMMFLFPSLVPTPSSLVPFFHRSPVIIADRDQSPSPPTLTPQGRGRLRMFSIVFLGPRSSVLEPSLDLHSVAALREFFSAVCRDEEDILHAHHTLPGEGEFGFQGDDVSGHEDGLAVP
jgi:hypothetical protein